MAEILSIISLVGFIVAGVCFVLSVVLFIVFRIPSVIGDLSGRTARRSIAKQRERNEQKGTPYRSAPAAPSKGGKSGGRKNKRKTQEIAAPQPASGKPETGLLEESRVTELERPPEEQTTALLSGDGYVRTDEEDFFATERLLLDDEETGLLLDDGVSAPSSKGMTLRMLDNVMLIHTDEVI